MNKIPKLRFPEFSGEWEEKYFKDLVKKEKKITYGVVKPGDYTKDGIPLIKARDYSNKWNTDNLFQISKELDFSYKRSKVQKGDLLFTIVGSVGNIGIVPEKLSGANITQQTARMSISKDFSNIFIYNFLMTETNKKETINYLKEGVQPSINLSDLEKFKINTPSLPEQEEIASFLSSVDSKIEKLERKKELWEQYKKGMMQKIFSQELRFKDENEEDYPEWEEKRFGDLYSFKTTNSYSRDNLNYEIGEVKNIHYGDIHTKFGTLFDIDRENVPFINQDVSLEKISSENYCQNGDIVIADASEDYADIGKSIEITNTGNKKILAGLHTFLARPLSEKIALGFGGYLMKSSAMHSQIKVIAQGTKVLSISTKRVADLKFPLPSLPEQTQIADFLSSLDSKIEIVEKELAGMKEFKKGLLQKMFV